MKHTKQTIRKIITDVLTQDKADHIRITSITQNKAHKDIWDVEVAAKEIYISANEYTEIDSAHMFGNKIIIRLYYEYLIIRIILKEDKE